MKRYIKERIFRRPPKKPKFFRQKDKFLARYPGYEIGDGSYGIPDVFDWNEGATLRIGSFCSIGDNVRIYLGGHHRLDWVSCYPFPEFIEQAKKIADYGGSNGDVTIGSDVWIASNAVVLSGVCIGHGAVVANSSVVTRDVEPYAIVAGNPAKLLRYRFDENTRTRLLDIRWWDWPLEEIFSISHLLCGNDMEAFFEYSSGRECK
ncbi:MAG: CatB-related O-acetyltransferase [Gammaproteobacteria bacterium]|nr:MAG: CatB-related O-acetyltransferase [Gammaproteobacteria bacterium]